MSLTFAQRLRSRAHPTRAVWVAPATAWGFLTAFVAVVATFLFHVANKTLLGAAYLAGVLVGLSEVSRPWRRRTSPWTPFSEFISPSPCRDSTDPP